MKRYDWVDVAKGIGIILVVMGHSRFNTGIVARWIASFHMPLFFVLAGFCYDEFKYPTYAMYVKRKVLALVYPYFTLSLLVIGMFQLLYFGDDPAFTAKQLFIGGTLKGSTFGAFWFITSLFCVELLYAGFARLVSHRLVRIVSMLSVSLSSAYLVDRHWPYFFDATFAALFFYAFGHFMRTTFKKEDNITGALIWGSSSLILHFCILGCLYFYKPSFVGHDFGNPILYFICAILGSMFLISMAVFISSKVKVLSLCKTPLIFLGKNTIVLLATHNALGVCRQSWIGRITCMNGMASVLLELMLLCMLIWLLSGCFRGVIDFNVMQSFFQRKGEVAK